jgi:transposase
MPFRYFSPGERRRLLNEIQELADDGLPARRIADELGLSRKTVEMWAKGKVKWECGGRLGKRPDIVARALTLDLLGRGMTLGQVAKARGVARTSVLIMVRRLARDGLTEKCFTPGAPGCRFRWRPTTKWRGNSV